mmetsp:Transcript_10895/g.16058  ORF Transcript_10895/g.16058 Transcript_10895/m.16058 type:complete len:754 (+) Transcript_10895:107-2368(+)
MKFLHCSPWLLLLLTEAIPPTNAFSAFSTLQPKLVSSSWGQQRLPSTQYSKLKMSTSSIPAKEEANYQIGDTKGATLLLENVSISRGINTLLENVNWRIEAGEKWGIVGANGAGKSTLLGGITGQFPLDGGKALVAPKVRVGWLQQTAVAGSTRSVREEAASQMTLIQNARRKMEDAEKAIADGNTSDAALQRLTEATEEFQNVGGYTQDQQIYTVLTGLGFAQNEFDASCTEFSGGWQMRIALAKLLLSNPTLLLLDEPSNHLDATARDWLATYLKNYDGTMILVSHDVSLLESSVNSIAEVVSGGASKMLLPFVSCTYSQYLKEKEIRASIALAEYERNVAEAAKLQAFVDRFGASATKASSAQSRVKQLEKMKREGKLDLPPSAEALMAKKMKPTLVLPEPPKSMGEELIVLEHSSIGYSAKEVLLKDVSLVISRGMKLVLRGPNGAGKSTLMGALRGTLDLIEGERIENEKLRLGVFTQDLAQELDVTSRAMDLVLSYAREGPHGDINISNNDARSVMGRLGLSGDKSLRKVGELSGGEKARVALSMFCLKASNVLMLDEPSNHLDVECIEALADALSDWGNKDGAIIVVSHDRSFCEAVGFTHVGTVKNGKVTIEERDLAPRDWEQYDIKSKSAMEGNVSRSINGSSGGSSSNGSVTTNDKELTPEEKEEQKLRRKMKYNAPKRISKLEELIEKAELKIANYDEEMMKFGDDVGKLVDINKKKEEEQERVMEYMEEWEELETLLAEDD